MMESGVAREVTTRTGSLRARDFSADRGRFAFTFSDFTTPTDLWTRDDGTGEVYRLTDANPQIGTEIAVADGEILEWAGKGGMRIEGFFMNSLGHTAGEMQPMIVDIRTLMSQRYMVKEM